MTEPLTVTYFPATQQWDLARGDPNDPSEQFSILEDLKEADAKRLAMCWNHHSALVGALKAMVAASQNNNRGLSEARKLADSVLAAVKEM